MLPALGLYLYKGDSTVAATKLLTVTSGLTSLTGNTTGDALNVSNSTSIGNIAVFKDNSAAVLTIADTGIVTFQNTANSSSAFSIKDSSSTTVLSVDTQSQRLNPGTSLSYTTSISRTTTEMVNANDVAQDSSIAIGVDGFPVIAHGNNTDGDLNVTKCDNAACTSSSTVELTNADNVGEWTSIAIGTDEYCRLLPTVVAPMVISTSSSVATQLVRVAIQQQRFQMPTVMDVNSRWLLVPTVSL